MNCHLCSPGRLDGDDITYLRIVQSMYLGFDTGIYEIWYT